jgi:ssDNA-specific exonuclease RecJ
LLVEKLVNKKHFPTKEKFGLFSRKCFLFILNEKHFSEVVKNLKILCNLLIISNLILKLLIAIYFVLNLVFFQFHPLEFDLI